MHASTVQLMHAETEEEFASPSWMNIRLRHTLPPMDGANRSRSAFGEEVQLDADGHHEALDVREQLSTVGQTYQNGR